MKDKFWNKEFRNNLRLVNRKRANSFRDKLNIVFKVITKSEWIHPKLRASVLYEIKEALKQSEERE